MTDKTTKAARSLADRAEGCADLAMARHTAAYDQGDLSTLEAWAGCVAIGLTYAAVSVARMFTQDES